MVLIRLVLLSLTSYFCCLFLMPQHLRIILFSLEKIKPNRIMHVHYEIINLTPFPLGLEQFEKRHSYQMTENL